MGHGEAKGLGEDCFFFFRTGGYAGEDRADSCFVVVPAAEDFKGPFHVFHFVAAVHHGHNGGLVGEFAGRAGHVGEAGGEVKEDIAENASCHFDKAGHAIHSYRFS